MLLRKIDYDYYLGNFNECYLGYSNDLSIRNGAASGGIVSSILIYLLKKKLIDGALVCKSKIVDGNLGYEIMIAKTPKEVLSCRTSVYFDVPITSYISKIKKFKGKLAIVGLPCHLMSFKKIMDANKDFNNKIYFMIGLFCGHNSKKELILRFFKKKGINVGDIEKFYFRKGLWRGNMHVEMKDGTEKIFPFSDYSIYQNLHFFSLPQCLNCGDHTAELSDLSCGDAWLNMLKDEPVKYSTLLTRSKKGSDLLKKMEKENQLHLEVVGPRIIFNSQKRGLIFHKSLRARQFVGKFFDINISGKWNEDLKINDVVAAFIALFNYKVSQNRFFRWLIFKIPRKILFFYMVFFKLLTNF